jgi:choline dehydrogenase-like flavoprotein
VCVIGAGVAGLIAATRIAAGIRGRVVVIESGGDVHDPRVTGLDVVDDPTGNYTGTSRGRGMGGTSALWAGKLLPLSAHDLAPRPYVGLDGWPIEAAALNHYLPEIEEMAGVATDPYDGEGATSLDAGRGLPATPGDIVWRWPKHPARHRYRIDDMLGDRLAAQANLSTWTDATVTSLTVAEGRLAEISATNHHGGELAVEADHFVIAAGTLESTRLLLLADAQNNGVISRTTDALGRFFNDHFGINVAFVRPRPGVVANRALADRFVHGTKRHLHGELSEAVQRAQGVASAYFDIDPHFSPGSAVAAAVAAADDLRQRRAGSAARHLANALTGFPQLARALWWKEVRGQQYWPGSTGISVKIWIEQLPRHGNRLLLSERRDSLGQPMLRADMVLGDENERTARAMVEVLHRFWTRDMAHLGLLEPIGTPTGHLIDSAAEQAHPAGSTRMGHDPAHSVVDPSLRVHAISNVHVASASAFPSSGSANPTLAIMQLAMLAADAVIRAQGDNPA